MEKARYYAFGSHLLDRDRGLLLHDGQPLPLTYRAFEVFTVLIDHRGEAPIYEATGQVWMLDNLDQ
jgi:DNA-binding winged helix-turn-helix (wHTH) protein